MKKSHPRFILHYSRWQVTLLLLAVLSMLAGRCFASSSHRNGSGLVGELRIDIDPNEVKGIPHDKYPMEKAMIKQPGNSWMPDYHARVHIPAFQRAQEMAANTIDSRESKELSDPGVTSREKAKYLDKLKSEFVFLMRQWHSMFDEKGYCIDSGNERMKVCCGEDNYYMYEGGKDVRGNRAGKGYVVGKCFDDAYIGGWCKNYRQGFGIEINFVDCKYSIFGGIYQAGELVGKVPIPCHIINQLLTLKETTNRYELFKCILVHIPIAQCIADPENLFGTTTDEQHRKPELKSGYIHDEGGDEKTFRFGDTTAFCNGIGGKSEVSTVVMTDFKPALENSRTFLFSTTRKFSELCIQLYSLTPKYAPQFRIYAVYRTMNDPNNKNKLHFVEMDDCDSSQVDPMRKQGGNGSGSRTRRRIWSTIQTETNKLYLIEVGMDPMRLANKSKDPIEFLKNGAIMLYFQVGREPLYHEMFGKSYEAQCSGDWNYKINFSEGGKVMQHLPHHHEKTQYMCGMLDLTLAPYVDIYCDSITFYYTEGEISENQKMRLCSIQLKTGVGQWSGWTVESPKLHYAISMIESKVRTIIAPLKLLLGIEITHKGKGIETGTVFTEQQSSDPPQGFGATLHRSRTIIFHPTISGRYCIFLFSCNPNYHPTLRIHAMSGDGKNTANVMEPAYIGNTAYYDLCSGEDYFAEIGINSSKTIKVSQNDKKKETTEQELAMQESFLLIFTSEVKDYYKFIAKKTYQPSAPSNVTYNTTYKIEFQGRLNGTFTKTMASQIVEHIGNFEQDIAPYFDYNKQTVSFYFPNHKRTVKESMVQPHGILTLSTTSTSGDAKNGIVEENTPWFPHAYCQDSEITELLTLTSNAARLKA